MLTLENVTLSRGTFTLHADLTVERGAFVAVIGPSGGGKSTLLAGIAGFLSPDTGRILLDGSDMVRLPPGRRPVSMVFQDNNLFPHLTVTQNVGLGLKGSLKLTPAEAAKVDGVLDRVGLGGFAARKPGALSGGQQSRVALARVLLADRSLVLLDEPFAALGPGLKDEMFALVADLLIGSGKTVLMITHDPEDALSAASEVIVVSDGLAHPPVATSTLFDAPTPELRAYLGERN